MNSDLSVNIGQLNLKNPVMVASGTFGYGEEFHKNIYDISKLGAVITKGISIKAREGNEPARIVETASGMINSIGLANVGLNAFLSEKLPFLSSTNATVIVNIFGESVDEYAELSSALQDASGVAAVEVNISCPNVKAGGVHFGTDEKSAAKVVKKVRKSFSRTVVVKLSPQVLDIRAIAKAVEDAGADAVSLINTIPAMAIDIETRRPVLKNITGGLSGPAIKPVALRLVHLVAKVVKIPVIGIGGIMNASDAIEFFLAGARAVQIGSANFVNPGAALEIIDGIQEYLKRHEFIKFKDIIGGLEV